MSGTVDERIVEMRFDNQQFEKNAQTSIKTLEELNKSLKFDNAEKTFSSLQDAASKVDMSGLADNVQSVADRFSVFGIVADQVIRRITDSVLGLSTKVTGLVKSMSVDQILAGWGKYEEKTASVQTLLNSTGDSMEQVDEYLSKLMWYSDETSFGFTDMTKALATMSAAGGDVKKLIPMLMGVGNAVAFAGKGAAEFQRTVFNLNQSYSGGFLNSRDWYSLQQAGVNSKQLVQELIRAGEELGKIEKGTVTEANFASTLAKKWADTSVMERAFGYFAEMTEMAYELVNNGDFDTATEAYRYLATQYDTVSMKAAKSAQEAKSFNEVIEATKDAVSSKWMNIFEQIFGNYQEQKVLWSDMAEDFYTIFAEGLDNRTELFAGIFSGSSGWDQLTSRITDAGVSLEQFDAALEAVYDGEDGVEALKEKYGSLSEAIRQGGISSNYVKTALSRLSDGMQTTSKESVNLEDKLIEIQDVADRVLRGEFGNGHERREKLEALGYEYDYIQQMAAKSHHGNRLTLEDVRMFEGEIENLSELSDEQREALKALVEGSDDATESLDDLLATLTRKSGRELLSESIKNILQSIIQIKDIYGEASEAIFGNTEERAARLYKLVDGFHKFTESLALNEEQAGYLKSALSGLMSIVKFFGITAKRLISIVSPLFSIFSTGGSGILKLSGSLGEIITKFVKWYETSERLNSIVDSLRSRVERFSEVVRHYVGIALDKINGLLPKTREEFEKLFTTFKQTTIGQYLINIKNRIVGLFTQLKGIDFSKVTTITGKITDVFSSVWAVIKKVYQSIKRFLTPYISAARAQMLSLGNSIRTTVSGWIEFWRNIQENEGILNFITRNISEFIQKVIELKNRIVSFVSSGGLKQIFSGFLERLGPIKEKFGEFIQNIKQNLESIDWGKALVFTLGLTMVPVLLSIGKAFGEAANLFKTGKGLLANINGVLLKFKNGFKTTAMEIAEAAVVFSVAIGILAGSIWLVSRIPVEKLKSSVIALLSVMVVFSGITLLVGLLGKHMTEFPKIALGMLAMAGAVLILVGALWALQHVTVSLNSIITVTYLITLLIAATAVLNAVAPKLEKTGLFFLAFSTSILILANAMTKITEIPMDKLQNSFEVIAGLMLAMAAIGVASSATKGGGFGVLGIMLSMFLLIRLAKKLADPEVQSTLKAVMSNTRLLWQLFAVLASLALVASLGGEGALKTGVGIALISASLLILHAAIKKFGSMDPAIWKQGLITVGIAISLFTLFASVARVGLGDPAKVGKAVLMMSAALLLVYVAVKKIGELNPRVLVQGMSSIVIIFGLFAALSAAMKASSSAKTGPIIAMAVAIGVLAGALAVLTLFSWGDLLKSTITLGAVMLAFGKAMQMASKASFDKKSLIGFGAAVAALGGIAFALYKLSGQNWASLATAAGGISACLLAIAATMKITSGLKFDLSDLAAFAAALAGLFVISLILKSLTNQPWQSLLAGAAAISAVLLAIAGALSIISFIPVGLAFKGAINLLIGIGALGAIVLGLGWLMTEFEGIEGKLEKGVTGMTLIGEAIGGFVGGIAGGAIAGLTSGLPDIGDNLSQFMENAQGFFDGLNGVNPEGPTILANLLSSLADITAAGALDNLVSFFTKQEGTLDKLPNQMAKLGQGFQQLVANLPDESGLSKIKSVTPALQSFTDLSNSIPEQGGWIDKIFGEQDLGKFGSQLASFGWALKAFGESVNGVNTAAISASVPAVNDISTIAAAIPTEGGFFELFTGGTAWDSIKEHLFSFGLTLRDYGVAVANLNVSSIAASVPAAQNIAKIITSIPAAAFNGIGDIASFKQKLLDYGNAIIEYSNVVANVNYYAIEKVPELKIAGENVGQAIADGATRKKETIVSAIRVLMTAAANAVTASRSLFSSAGGNAAAGIGDGINNNQGWPIAAIQGLAQRMREAFEKEMEIKSPSRVMAEVARYIPLGIAKGVSDNESYALDSMEHMGDYMVMAMSPAMGILSDLMSGNYEFDPTIRPVIDLSELQAQTNQINGLFGNSAVNLTASVMGSVEAGRDYLNGMSSYYSSDIKTLISLNRELLAAAKAGGNVYLDSNVIAGSVNSRLGLL